jgi:hypothetical protein
MSVRIGSLLKIRRRGDMVENTLATLMNYVFLRLELILCIWHPILFALLGVLLGLKDTSLIFFFLFLDKHA